MRIILMGICIFLTLCFGFYAYALKAEINALYAHFKNFRQQNCEFIAQFSTNHQCNELIAYKFKTVLIKPPYIKANENYVFFYQLQVEDALKLDNWLLQQAYKERVNDDELGLFSASWPKKKVHFLAQLKRYCLDKDQSCMGRFWRMHDNSHFQPKSYIVYGDDQKYWNVVQQRDFQCDENIEIDQQALKADFPSIIYQPQSMHEYHYLFCWEAERRLLRISSVITEAYLR